MNQGLTTNDKAILISLDNKTQKTLSKLVSLTSLPKEDLLNLVANYGLRKIKIAITLYRKTQIPIQLCASMIKNPIIFQSVARHNKLTKFLRELTDNSTLQTENSVGICRPKSVIAGTTFSKDCTPTIMSITDLFSTCSPSQEDLTRHPELNLLSNVSPTTSRYHIINGSFGYIEIAILVCTKSSEDSPLKAGESFLLITNGQAQSSFFSLPPKLRNHYKKWYENLVNIHIEAAIKSGIKHVAIVSNDLVRENIFSILKHEVPDSVLDQFYDRYSEKRGFSKHNIGFEHPVNKLNMTGDIWIKPCI